MPDRVEWLPMLRTERIWHVLFPIVCPLCGRKHGAGHWLCPTCREKNPARAFQMPLPVVENEFWQAIAPYPYEKEIRHALLLYKFYNHPEFFRFFGDVIASVAVPLSPLIDVITYVPTSGQRVKERGYDQAMLLAKRVGKRLDIPVESLLRKVRHNQPQHDLSRSQREKNVRGVYQLQGDCRGKRVLLVDDIITTGFTMREAGGLLYRGGAQQVYGATAAIRGCNGEKGIL